MHLPSLSSSLAVACSAWCVFAHVALAQPIRLAKDPALSPDGKTLTFAWRGDIWTVPVSGGAARRLTENAAIESSPAFSPDGKEIAFLSDRDRSRQVYLKPVAGGDARQLTWHTDGYELDEWLPDGKGLLVGVARDFSWMRESRSLRLAVLDATQRRAEQVLLDDYATDGAVSPDGRRVLFVREGESWWRQGYRGARAGQIWLLDRGDGSCRQIKGERTESRWPLWRADGAGFFYVSNRGGVFNLWEYEFTGGKETQRTSFQTDGVVFPAIARDGRTIVFRHLFDLYRWRPGSGAAPEKIAIQHRGDALDAPVDRLVLERATEVTFTSDGLQMAFLAGGDVWVMDTELREPRQVTRTAEEERGVTFAPDGKSLCFVSDAGGQTDLWKATPAKPGSYWWENTSFPLKRITDDAAPESGVKFTRDSKRVVYVKERGDLWLSDAEGHNLRRLVESWDAPSFDISPDGAWIAYSRKDEWFNGDVWLVPTDGSHAPFNLSRHPDNDWDPQWSPDGRAIAWVGKREGEEADIHYVWLRAEDEERTKRERTLTKAREKIAKAVTARRTTTTTTTPPKPPAPPPEPVRIDFDDIHERIHRLRIPDTTESGLAWSPDAKKLAFAATIAGKRGTYTVEMPDDLKPKLLAETTLTGDPQWLRRDDTLVGLSDGKPAAVSGKGTVSTFPFKAPQSVVRADKQRAIFDQCWRTMRDRYYDERLGNRDWDAIRAKYADAAATAPDLRGVQEVVHLMLGELNGSHLGLTLQPASAPANVWREETAHLGLRFDPAFAGPGWKVRDVLPKGPASQQRSRIEAGEVVLKIDGRDLSAGMDASEVLNGPLERDITLRVASTSNVERDVTLRPISYAAARALLYEAWIKAGRAAVEKASGGALGYLHISKMDDASFQEFEEALYAAGAGRDGLIIDVRENGGGSTTDHLLTALSQPAHAITVPRGGTPGYPQDRIVYATWHKPIAVLCNQNSFSNAEIFSHAIKTLKRGQLIGVPTAGGVISTGSVSIMDVGTLRLPFRGWFVPGTGEDMELNGAVPDHLLWPQPGDLARGVDTQLDKAIEVLKADVAEWKRRPQSTLRKASERR
jgi:tricorn protease